MGELVSPNQMGDKGNKGEAPANQGGSLVSPREVGNKGGAGAGADQASGGKIVSPGGMGNAKEANGHGDGRSSKGNDAPKNRAWMS